MVERNLKKTFVTFGNIWNHAADLHTGRFTVIPLRRFNKHSGAWSRGVFSSRACIWEYFRRSYYFSFHSKDTHWKSSQKLSQYFTCCKGHSAKALFNTYFSSMCTGCLGSAPVNTAILWWNESLKERKFHFQNCPSLFYKSRYIYTENVLWMGRQFKPH